MLTFMPSGRFTKKHAFYKKKMETQIIMKQSLKPYLEEMFVMRRCTHLPNLGALSLCMIVLCDLHGRLGGKAKLNHI
jgi:hypothetical protein